MKCFLVLLAVAVCRGFPRDILDRMEKPLDQLEVKRDSMELKGIKNYDPLENNQLVNDKYEDLGSEEKLTPSVNNELLPKFGNLFANELNGLFRNQEPIDMPFKTRVDQDKFLDYVTFDRKPWQQMTWVPKDPFSYNNIQDLIQFPGGDFLKDEIEKYLYSDILHPGMDVGTTYLPSNIANIKDVHEIIPIVANMLVEKVPAYTQLIKDPHTVALLVTRDTVKVILKARMFECPTTAMDKHYIKTVQQQLIVAMKETEVQLEEFMRTWLPRVMPRFPTYTIDQLVYRFTKDVQQHIFKDVAQYAYGVGFKDVAIDGHQLYHEVKKYVDNYSTDAVQTIDGLVKVVADIITERMVCPRREDFAKKIKFACNDFNSLFVERLTSQIFSRVENILHHIQTTTFVTEDYTRDYPRDFYPRADETLKIVLKEYIRTIVQQVPVCDNQAICRDTTSCIQDTEQILKPGQMEYMKTMLKGDWNNVWSKDYQIPSL